VGRRAEANGNVSMKQLRIHKMKINLKSFEKGFLKTKLIETNKKEIIFTDSIYYHYYRMQENLLQWEDLYKWQRTEEK